MSKVIFGTADVDSGMVVCDATNDDTQENTLIFNCFGDGSHAFAELTIPEAEALHIGLSRYLGVPHLTVVEEEPGKDG